MDSKSEVRRRMRLVATDIDDALMRSVELWARLAELGEYRTATTVMAFAAVRGEPDTDGLHARIQADGKRLVLPRLDGERIVPAVVVSATQLSRHGIAEPDGPAVPVEQLHLVIVPGLAFTADGARLGRGGGHYDRFLAGVPAPTVGVCFVEQLCDDLPVEAHDVRVHRVLTA